MLYDMQVVNNGVEETWTFGSNSNAITDARGKRLNPKPLIWSPWSDFKFHWHLSTVDIILGHACNLHCKFCFQRVYRDIKVPKVTEARARRLVEMIREAAPNLQRFRLWGGEPLVYIKALRILLPILREAFPDAYITTVSNGILLTREMVDFFEAHRLALGLSYDAGHRGDGLDAMVLNADVFKYAKERLRMWVQVTPSKGDEDVEATVGKVFSLIGPLRIVVDNVERAFSAEEAGELMDLDKYMASYDRLSKGPYAKHVSGRLVDQWRARIPSRTQLSGAEPHCGIGGGFDIFLDMEGNVYKCHARAQEIIGHITDLESIKSDYFIYAKDRPGCLTCPMRAVCKGGCPLVEPSGFEFTCKNLYAACFASFKVAMREMYGVEVLSLKPHGENNG